ncbi:peroxiredoxin-like family protein [Hwanghaeella sp.]|uniref:peroxiredoxin-like family protein n=1 Tax=Hwanghaeella sp. TaxID=2605943 RepID=UPI003CCBB22B
MSQQAILYPRQQVPALEVPLVGGGTFNLAEEKPENFTMVVFYRGLHCPICSMYLADLHNRLDALTEKGVNVIVLSSDNEERATEAKEKWKLPNLRLGYGISLDTAREWGLYVSTGRGKTSIGVEEPALFSEPALYLVRPNGELYFGTVQTMPFARPAFGDIVKALDFVIANDYPGRGEVIDHAAAAE